MIWRLPNGSNNLARLDIKRRVCGFVVGHYCFTRWFNKNPLMPFSRSVALVHFVSSNIFFGHHRYHKLACCTCFAFVVVCCIDSCSFSRRVSRVCLERFSSFDVDVFFLCLVTWKCNFEFYFWSMKFCDVIAGAFGISGCIHMPTVLHDAAIVVQFWRAIEHNRLQSMMSLVTSFRCVFFAVFQTCVRGEHGKFVAGGRKKHWLRRDCAWCGRCVSCDRTPGSQCAFVQELWYVNGEILDEFHLQMDDVAVFGWARGCPIAVEIQHYSTSRVVFVVLLLDSFVYVSIQQESVNVVFTLRRSGSFCQFLIMLFGHHQRHKLACSTCFAFGVVRFIDSCSFSRAVSRVCLEWFASFVVVVVFRWSFTLCFISIRWNSLT